MSQKSTARTGSEGDVEVKEVPNINARPGDSSCKSKRDLLGGPFGDSPYDQAQDAYQDYLLIMFHNEEESAGTSESSQPDGDLYNMRYNYTEQLNLVRKKLNLMELSEDAQQRCTITEIMEDEPGSSKQNESVPKPNSLSYQRPVSSDAIFNNANKSKCLQLTTIHPFSHNYNLESRSSSHILEQDYRPPMKKVCQRLQTPRFISISEGNVPYNTTKVQVHDAPPKEEKKENIFASQVVKNFTETRQTQCNEEEFDNLNFLERETNIATASQSTDDKLSVLNLSFETETDSEYGSKKSQSLFPNVIIETRDGRQREESSLSSQSSKKFTNTSSSRNLLSLNSVRGSSDEEEFYTVRVTKTTIDAADQKKKKVKGRRTPLKKMTMFEEMTRLRSGTSDIGMEDRGQGDAEQTGDASYDIRSLDKYVGKLSQNAKLGEVTESYGGGKSRLDRYIRQYVQYKTEMEKNHKHTIIGQRLVNIQNRIMDSPDKLYQSENSLVSDEEKQRKYTSSPAESSDSGDKRPFWERLCFCLCPGRDFND